MNPIEIISNIVNSIADCSIENIVYNSVIMRVDDARVSYRSANDLVSCLFESNSDKYIHHVCPNCEILEVVGTQSYIVECNNLYFTFIVTLAI